VVSKKVLELITSDIAPELTDGKDIYISQSGADLEFLKVNVTVCHNLLRTDDQANVTFITMTILSIFQQK